MKQIFIQLCAKKKKLATLPKLVHNSSGGHQPQVENHWFTSLGKRQKS